MFCALALLLQVHRYAWILQRLDTSREDHPPLHRSMIIVAHVMLYLVLLCIALSPHSVEADFSPWRDQEHERDMRKRKTVERKRRGGVHLCSCLPTPRSATVRSQMTLHFTCCLIMYCEEAIHRRCAAPRGKRGVRRGTDEHEFWLWKPRQGMLWLCES